MFQLAEVRVDPLDASRVEVSLQVETMAANPTYVDMAASVNAIQAAAEQEKMKLIDEILPRSAYDNDLLRDVIDVAATAMP